MTTTLTGIGQSARDDSPLDECGWSIASARHVELASTPSTSLATHRAPVVPRHAHWQYAVAADVNGDGIEDLVTTGTSADVEVLTQLGSVSVIPQFHQTVIPHARAIELIAVGDFDGDRLLDVAMAAVDGSSSHAGDIDDRVRRAAGRLLRTGRTRAYRRARLRRREEPRRSDAAAGLRSAATISSSPRWR